MKHLTCEFLKITFKFIKIFLGISCNNVESENHFGDLCLHLQGQCEGRPFVVGIYQPFLVSSLPH